MLINAEVQEQNRARAGLRQEAKEATAHWELLFVSKTSRNLSLSFLKQGLPPRSIQLQSSHIIQSTGISLNSILILSLQAEGSAAPGQFRQTGGHSAELLV